LPQTPCTPRPSSGSKVDKLTNLDRDLYEQFDKLVNEVIGTARIPYFLLARSDADTPAILGVLRPTVDPPGLARRGQAAAPGTRYLLHVLDFGTYSDVAGIVLRPTDAPVVAVRADPLPCHNSTLVH